MQNSLTEISSDCIQTVMDGLRKIIWTCSMFLTRKRPPLRLPPC